jgi:DNA-binding MltR family transcriptional regulator
MPWITLSTTDEPTFRNALPELDQDNDRAAAIVGAVFVEESLTALASKRLNRNQDIINDLFRPSGPLGPFSTKIDMGVLLGLYSDAARKELHTLRRIRNEFAHQHARDFAHKHIQDLASNLTIAEQTTFYTQKLEDGRQTLNVGTVPDSTRPHETILPSVTADKLTVRERYIRSCQFYSGALLFVAMQPAPAVPAVAF